MANICGEDPRIVEWLTKSGIIHEGERVTAVEIKVAMGQPVVAKIERFVELSESMEHGELLPGKEWIERTLDFETDPKIREHAGYRIWP